MKSWMKLSLVGLAACSSVNAANAATIVQQIVVNNGANTVASGIFSYDSSKTGVLNYSDLISFSLTGVSTYNLAFINSLDSSAYKYFGYNTAKNSFNVASIPGSVGPNSGVLAGVNGSLSKGFFFDPLPGQPDPSGTGADGLYRFYDTGSNQSYTSISISAVSEPATWALIIVGFGIAGVGLRRRTANVAVRYSR